jgi:hypothetical protein
VADDPGIAAAWWRGLEPPAVATVSDWAQTFRIWAGRTTAAAGRYRFDRVPYLREPMDALSERSGVQRVVVMKAARLGFTEGLVTNLVGYAMHQAPGPILVVVPTRDIAVRLARESIDPMCESTPEVAVRLGRKHGSGARHATLHKEFPRGSLTIVGARSAAALRQTSARYPHRWQQRRPVSRRFRRRPPQHPLAGVVLLLRPAACLVRVFRTARVLSLKRYPASTALRARAPRRSRGRASTGIGAATARELARGRNARRTDSAPCLLFAISGYGGSVSRPPSLVIPTPSSI